MAILVSALTAPYCIYHKDFALDYGPQLIEISRKKLLRSPDKELRDVRREKIEGVIKGIDNMMRRLETREEREKQTEVLKLEVILMCLKS